MGCISVRPAPGLVLRGHREQAWPPGSVSCRVASPPARDREGLLDSAFCSRGISQLSNALY